MKRIVSENTVRQGRKSGITIKTMIDDATGIETHDIRIWRGKRKQQVLMERDSVTKEVLTVNGEPVSTENDLYGDFSRLLATLSADLVDKAPGEK